MTALPFGRSATSVVALRPVTEADREFLVGVYASARDEELSQVEWAPGQREWFVRMQFEAQDTDYRRTYQDGSFEVIEVDGRPAGRLYVARRPDEIRIIDLALLPEFRDAGLGGKLISDLMAEAAESDRKLSLHVEIHNRAAELYTRLGFVAVDERGLYRLMEWIAP